jgi:hypothetical protein
VHGSHEHIGLLHFVAVLISLLLIALPDTDRTGNRDPLEPGSGLA